MIDNTQPHLEPQVADPIDSDEHPIWIAIIGWLNSEGSDSSVAAVNAAIKAECTKREAKPLTEEQVDDIAEAGGGYQYFSSHEFAKAVEAAHGIMRANHD